MVASPTFTDSVLTPGTDLSAAVTLVTQASPDMPSILRVRVALAEVVEFMRILLLDPTISIE